MSTLLTDEKLNLAVSIAGLGLGEVDYRQDTITLDPRSASFFDLPASEPLSRKAFHARIHPADRDNIVYQVDNVLIPDGEDVISVTHRVINPDGSTRWLRARKQINFEIVDGVKEPVSGLVAIQDITTFKETEEHIQNIMGEVAHRSKNLLGVVQGIARLTARHASPEDFMPQFTARLNALAKNKDVLAQDKWRGLSLQDLITMQLEPYITGETERVTYQGPEILLHEKSAQAIGMALHELSTNAVKYGALSNQDGHISLVWTVHADDEPQFSLKWVESGGPPVQAPTRKGFGDRVIRQMTASSVSGRVILEYDPKGVEWELKAPLANLTEDTRDET